MKATAITTTKVFVHISMEELVEFARTGGVHIPADAVSMCAYACPFDEHDGDGIVIEWYQGHAEKQG